MNNDYNHVKSPPVDINEAIEHEKSLTFREALKLYPTAMGWSVFVSIGVIMLAFDPQIVGNMFAIPQFKKDFGVLHPGGEYVIPARWQTGLSLGNPLGQVIGALVSAYPMEAFGRKRTFFTCVFLTAGLVFIQFFARSLSALLVGELLGGLVLGCFVVIGPTYASEVCPLALRGYLTSFTNLCFVTGQLLGNGVTAATATLHNHWAYSIPFALQWFWVLLIVPGIFFVPESPWWLVRKGRHEQARDSLRRLSSNKHVDVDATLAAIAETDRLELEMEAGSTYLDTVKGVNLRRTEISAGVYTTQVLSGIYLINYGTYFFQQAGVGDQDAFYLGIGFLAVGWVSTVISWYFINLFGRRRIYNTGLAVCVVLMFAIGVLDTIPGRPSAVKWAESSLMLVWNGAYDLSVGPVTFVILGECSATRVRSKTIAVATAVQAVVGIVMTVAIPYLINPDEANLQGKLGYFFGGLGGLCLVWSYFRVPETKGRTYEDLDVLFDRRVPARQFKTYRIE
ncbi:putative maltose permease [Xylariaceae sp. FL0594]|nr:putative maltose permease [Xylariaceae sp. FL0594]